MPNVALPAIIKITLMKFEEIFNDKHLLLPKSIPPSKNFRTFLNEVLDNYIELLESISPKIIKLSGNSFTNNMQTGIVRQKELIKGINAAIGHYYDGRPFLAYQEFAKTMETRILKYSKMLNIRKYSPNNNFYRIRIKNDNQVFSPNEMFHIPFQFRGKVSTQRYSIPGFPSLYLGTSLYVCWEELNRPKIDEFQTVRLQSKKEIRFLDLTNPKFNKDEINSEAYRYIMTWPLIAACSIRVKDTFDNFKPEYIIPQLLLQWARDYKGIDGIRYTSTHIEASSLASHTGLSNLVMPVKENNHSGFCNELSSTFEMTETISWRLLEFASGGQTYLYTQEEIYALNKKVPKLEIIKGVKSSYSSTSFGKLERYLNNLVTKPIKE